MKEGSLFSIPKEFIFRAFPAEENLREYRTVFMRDRDRLLYSTAIRRLAGKTQIYTIGNDDHKKNRLTHSLEVAQISRTIAGALGLNCDLAEAIALGHDFGHTPFGHAGERMLHEIMIPRSNYVENSPFYHKDEETIRKTIERESVEDDGLERIINFGSMFGFKHNLQSVRVASVIEDNYRDDNGVNIGLNLTNYTLWGMMHHSKCYYEEGDEYPNYQNQFSKLLLVKGKTAEAWSLESYIVEIADDIAQWHHDLEDAVRGNAMPVKTICDTIYSALGKQLQEHDQAILQKDSKIVRVDRKCIADLSHIVVNTLVNDVVDTSKKNLDSIKSRLKEQYNDKIESANKKFYLDYDSLDLNIARSGIIAMSDKISKKEFKDTVKNMVHHSREVERMNEKGKYIIRKIFEAYISHPQQLPDGVIVHFMTEIGRYKTIEEAIGEGIGIVRTEFEKEMINPKLIYQALLMRRICDHIAAMTDRYAIEEHHSLYD